MNIVLATNSFASIGGSETYLLTVAEQLQRLGHGATIHAVNLGEMAELAAGRGIAIAPELDDLPAQCDVVVTQDGGMAYTFADRLPRTPQVFVCHSVIFDLQLPPLLPGVAGAVVALSGRVERRVRALDTPHEVVRLRQPIDTERLVPRSAPRAKPERVLLLGNYLRGDARRVIQETWGAAGVKVVQVGHDTSRSLHPEQEIADVDIVVGKGRAVLDAMSCGRPAYIYDAWGLDGWVTPEHYPRMEAGAFAGEALPIAVSVDRLKRDLDDYDPLMGQANRDLIMNHHQAREHAEDLVGLFQRVAPNARPTTSPNRELARLVRHRWRDEAELFTLRRDFAAVADRTERDLAERESAHQAELHAVLTDLAERESAHRAELQAVRTRHRRALQSARAAADERLRAITGQRRVRVGLALGRASDRIRAGLRRARSAGRASRRQP